MSRAYIPAAPADDLSARRSRDDRIAEGSVISSELSAFMQSGIDVSVATVAAGLHPIAGIALACRIDPTGTVRVLLRKPANLALLDAIAQGGAVAVTFARPRDHRSIQIKARSAQITGVRADDPSEVTRQCARMRDEMIGAGYSPAFSAAYVAYEPREVVAIQLSPDRIFVQTPGPGAGSELPP
jgi:hypothetical protein